MRFRNDDYPPRKGQGSELTDTIAEEHPKHFAAVAEQQIMAMHHNKDGTAVELHEVGSKEFIAHSIGGSLEGKLTGSFESGNSEEKQNNLNAARIEYEKKSSQGQPQHDLLGKGQSKLYGAQQSVASTGTVHGQETMMMGCNCGAEWTVTGQSTKQGAESVKVEQYSSPGGQPGGYRISGAGPGEYRAAGGERQQYNG